MYRIYQIKNGDTLETIANKYGTTVDALKAINGLPERYVAKPNGYIIVPVRPKDLFAIYVVQKGDTLYDIARKHDTTVDNLARLNGLNSGDYIYPDQEIAVPLENVHYYFTKEEDTLGSAAEGLNTSVGELTLQNDTIYLLPDQLLIHKVGGSIE